MGYHKVRKRLLLRRLVGSPTLLLAAWIKESLPSLYIPGSLVRQKYLSKSDFGPLATCCLQISLRRSFELNRGQRSRYEYNSTRPRTKLKNCPLLFYSQKPRSGYTSTDKLVFSCSVVHQMIGSNYERGISEFVQVNIVSHHE